jgi:glycosyltransferase involved in cell wall biosynthesis
VSQHTPLVSIGLPVYNGDNYLADAIASVLSQTYTNLELIIADNGSQDRTAEICRHFAAQDTRVRYVHSEQNQGAAWNYNRVVALAQGKYFRWLAHDDLLAPTTLEKSVAILETHPHVVLCFTWTQDIDNDGNLLAVKHSTANAQVPEVHKRFFGLSRVHPLHNCEEVFGLIRIDILRKTKLIDNYTDSDRTLLAVLGLYGPFYEIPEPLFLHRIHVKSSVVVSPTAQSRAAWFDPKLRGRIVFPKWRQMYELFVAVGGSPLPFSEKLKCYFHLLRWIKRRGKNLRSELIWAARHLVSDGTV